MTTQWIAAPNLIPETPTAERSVEVYSSHHHACQMAVKETERLSQLVGVREVRGVGFVLYRVPLQFIHCDEFDTQPTLVLPRR